MSDLIRRFEIVVLRPLWLVFIAAGVFAALNGRWAWIGGSVLGCFLVGIIGARLHPHQSARDLASGPTTGVAALEEAQRLTFSEKTWLVDRACTAVGLLVGITLAIVLGVVVEWRWYIAIPLGCVALVIVGALLKMAFRTVGPVNGGAR